MNSQSRRNIVALSLPQPKNLLCVRILLATGVTDRVHLATASAILDVAADRAAGADLDPLTDCDLGGGSAVCCLAYRDRG